MNTNTKAYLEWKAPRRPDYKKSKQWYLTGAVACLSMVAYGILLGSWSTALVFAFIPALYFLVRDQSHQTHAIRLMELGVEYDGRLHTWGELQEFWILVGDGYHELHIAPVKRWAPEIIIQTEPMDAYAVRDALIQRIPQVATRREKILDAIIRFCKL